MAMAGSQTASDDTLSFVWCIDPASADQAAALFVAGAGPSYISHSDIQWGRAVAPGRWSDDLYEQVAVMAAEAAKRTGADERNPGIHLALALRNQKVEALAFVTLSPEARTPFAIMEDVIVSETSRGQGLGTAFIDWICAECRRLGMQQIFLESSKDNHRVHGLFNRVGFEKTSIVMRREL